MNRRITRCTAGLIVALGMSLTTPSATAKGGFGLISAVPDDVFICVATKHNPERQFVEDYWNEVIDALQATGVGTDAMGLIGSLLGDAQMADVERLKAKATRLIEGVDWKQLKGGEFVFAERLNGPAREGFAVGMGPPDMVFLIRGAEGSASKNYDGLVAIMREIAAEVNKAAEREVLTVDTTPRGGVKVATLMSPAAGPGLSHAVALHDQTIILVLGERMLDDVLNLMNGKGSVKSISASPRFKQAFAGLPPAEDLMSFFDVQALLESIKGIADFVFHAIDAEVADVNQGPPLSEEAKLLVVKATAAYWEKDYKQALVYTRKAHEVAPEDMTVLYNLACFSALDGNEDKALNWLEKAVDAGFYAPGKISGDSDLDSLRDSPRYKAALAKATEKARADGSGKSEWAGVAQRIVKRIMEVPGMVDYVASVEHTDGFSTRGYCNTVLVPGAGDKPFYSVFGKRKSLTAFDKYLPKETVSFNVNAGIDLAALYAFIEDTIREAGSKGQELLAQWEAVQAEVGFNLKTDLLGWIDSEMIQFTLKQPSGDATVVMVKVTNETIAREKLAAGLAALSAGLQQAVQQNPMLAMVAVQSSPSTHEKLPGFHNVTFGMQPQPGALGVANGYAIYGTSADAVALCLATAAGEHPSIKKNSQVMGEALVPDGPFRSMSFTDKREMGQKISEVLGAVGMMGGMAVMTIPDPQVQQALNKILQMIMKIGPVARKIDFYKSSASVVTFDGKVWSARGATNYKSPAERVAGAGQ